MDLNHLPTVDPADTATGCCPRFHPERWEGQTFHFRDKPFVHVRTRSVFHVPLDMDSVFQRTFEAINRAHADSPELTVLTRDESAWHADHYFAVTKDVPNADMVRLTGDYDAHVFEGSYADAGRWAKQLGARYVSYATCPRCAKAYGNNSVVALTPVKA